MKIYYPEIYACIITDSAYRSNVMAAVSSRDVAKNLVRVKSSNIWAYGIDLSGNPKSPTADVVVQFKSRDGGPGDIYMYYDVPKTLYRKWQGSPSKGHYFWQYIRGKFDSRKLTGDKKLKQKPKKASAE